MRVLFGGGSGDDRLDQKAWEPLYDFLCWWLFRVDFALAGSAKRAENLARGAIDLHRARGDADASNVK
jgi:hypothetical protein